MKYVLAIDQSTSASKAFLVDGDGFIVAREALGMRSTTPAPAG